MKNFQSKVMANNTFIKTDNLIRPLFDVEQMKKTITNSLQMYVNQMPMIKDMLKRQAPLIEAMVKQTNDTAKLYHSMFIDSGFADRMVRIQEERKKMEESLKNIIDISEPVIYTPRLTSAPIINEYRLSPETKKEFVEETAELIFQKIRENEELNKTQLKTEDKIVNMPKDANWYGTTIAICADRKIKIHYKDKLIDKVGYVKLGFSMGNTRDKRPNQSWKLLEALSVLQTTKDYAREATIENLMRALKITDKQLFLNVRSELASKLSKAIIDDDPFENYKKYGHYKLKFTLVPESLLRGDGEIYLKSSGFKEDYDPNAEQSQYRSGEYD
ncbi:hypothetical protein KJ761_03030 [Patescibacteria group bacterium]|nr:hypothetical protein [Patescibacteria group bacterium]